MASTFLDMIVIVFVLAITSLTLWFAFRSVTFAAFLCGGFFVSSGTLLYLGIARISVPLIGTNLVLSPRAHLARAGIHGLLFFVCLVSVIVRRRRAVSRT